MTATWAVRVQLPDTRSARTMTATWAVRVQLDTGHRNRSLSQTVAQREERLAAKELKHNPFFTTS